MQKISINQWMMNCIKRGDFYWHKSPFYLAQLDLNSQHSKQQKHLATNEMKMKWLSLNVTLKVCTHLTILKPNYAVHILSGPTQYIAACT